MVSLIVNGCFITNNLDNENIKRQIRDELIDTELDAGEVINTLIFSQERWKDYQVTPLFKNIVKDGIEL